MRDGEAASLSVSPSSHLLDRRSNRGEGYISPMSKTISIGVTGMTCAACQARVQRALTKAPGVERASVNLMTNDASVTYDDDGHVARAVGRRHGRDGIWCGAAASRIAPRGGGAERARRGACRRIRRPATKVDRRRSCRLARCCAMFAADDRPPARRCGGCCSSSRRS